MGYLYGEEIKYEYDLIKPEDYELLQAFSCGNEKMDHFIHDEMIKDGIVDSDDGLPFKVWNSEKREVFAVFSFAASGIIYRVDNYTHVLPAIKIDIFAVDTKYQKLHMDKENNMEINKNDPMYLVLD